MLWLGVFLAIPYWTGCRNHLLGDQADAYMFYRCFFPVRHKNTRQTFSGTAERIFMKLLPNDSGENGVCLVQYQLKQWQQQRLGIQQWPHGSLSYHLGLQIGQWRSMAASDTWQIEMKCMFPGPQQLHFAVLVLNIVLGEYRCVSIHFGSWLSGITKLKKEENITIGYNRVVKDNFWENYQKH